MTHADESGVPEGGISRRQAVLREQSGEHRVAVFGLDTEGRVSSWNPDAQRVKGYSAEEIHGRHFSVFYPPEVAARGYPDEELARAGEVGVLLDEGWRVRRDGSWFWAYIVIAAQRCEQGELQGFTKVVRDDTASHLRQQRSAQRFSDLLSLTPVGVALFDEQDRIDEVNEELCRLTGYSQRELRGAAATELLPPGERSEGISTEAGRDTGTIGPSGARQRTLVSRDGHPVICEVRYTPSVQDDGRRFWLVVFQDVTAHLHQAELLAYQATHDALTGLINRRGIEEMLHQATGNTAVLLCDLDNFKRVNDALGLTAGDEVLVQVARRLEQAQLPGCTPARLSGDEFLIVCTEVAAAGGLLALAEQVAATLRMTASVRGQLIRISASVGAAMLPAEVANGEDLLRYAETALLTAERRGPGRVQLAENSMFTQVDDQLRLEQDLVQALRTDALALYYQPIVDDTRSIVAVEALVRWPHPQRGLLSPAVILPTAEQAGLVHELDQWVLRTALVDASNWPDTCIGPVRVSVNLNNHTASDAEFLTTVGDTLIRVGMAPHRLQLEITESSLIELSETTRAVMDTLIDQGVTFAVDDFGTGYSSLARLKDLPVATIKLDREFIAGIEHHEIDRAIVRSAADMAHATRRHCVAEGVETTIQFHLLIALGIDSYQGYLFAHALPNEDLHALLNTQTPCQQQQRGQNHQGHSSGELG